MKKRKRCFFFSLWFSDSAHRSQPLLLPFNALFARHLNPTCSLILNGNLDLKQQSFARCNWNWPLAICRCQTERRINSNNNNALWTKWCLNRCAYLWLPAFLIPPHTHLRRFDSMCGWMPEWAEWMNGQNMLRVSAFALCAEQTNVN